MLAILQTALAGAAWTRPKTVADFGCGNGELLRALEAQRPRAQLAGFEPSPWAREHAVAEIVRRGDLLEKFAERHYDVVISKGMLQYVDDADLDLYLRRLRDARKGPVFFISVLSRASYEFLQWRDAFARVRRACFYKKALGKYFVSYGLYFYLRKDVFTRQCGEFYG